MKKRLKIPGEKRLYAVGSGPHWKEANVLRRQLGCHAILLAVVDEKGGIHVTGQTEPQSVGLFGAASIALQELAHRVQHLAMASEHWQAEEMSDVRARKPPVGTDGEMYPSLSGIQPRVVAEAALAMSPDDWKIDPPEEEKPS